MTYIVSSGALNSTHSLTHLRTEIIYLINYTKHHHGGATAHQKYWLDGLQCIWPGQ